MSKKREGSKIRVDMKYGFIYAVISVMTVGFIGCIAAFLFPNYWAIGLGVEIILTGCLSFMMIKHARTSESDRFKNLGWHMLFSGIVVIGFGILFHVYAEYALWLALPFFLLYAVFMGLCIISHINRENMTSLAGSIVLNNEIVLQEGGRIQK